MRFTTLALVACAAFSAAMADVSHLAKQYIPPRTMMPPNGAGMVSPNNASPIKHMGERTVTTIEKQELRELPTQTEYLLPGQMPYGIGTISSKNNYKQNGSPLSAHSDERPLEMMMPRELLTPPPVPKQEQQPVVMPTNQYLLPMGNKESTSQINQDSMPSNQYLAPPMNSSEQHQQMSSETAHSNQILEQQQPTVPSLQYLAPMSLSKTMDEQDHVSQETSTATPTNRYLAPLTMDSSEQQLQQQSAPAAQYVPPQQQMSELPSSQYLPPQVQSHEMQMQPEQGSAIPQAAHHLSPSSEMPQPLMNVVSQMQSSPEYLSPFGEGENVAEAAQEAAEMFDEQSVHQPTPPASIDEPTNYYLTPQSPEAQKLNYQEYPEQQPEQMTPVDFVRQHQQLMTQFESVNDAPVSFAQFQSISTATPIMQVAPEPKPAHFLAEDGYHYRNGVNSNGNTDVRRFRARQ
ncbi:uncharacterized protein LOC128861738 [Anastrepha ludens]|uniref:uncharacterized protein LOC128861738 n=1 Tax=Anastrepha ludens TaxID=28586 RepID=UPI0023B10782|nr:uncharacterized protein LOC128861738 [Anastrepha ludens]